MAKKKNNNAPRSVATPENLIDRVNERTCGNEGMLLCVQEVEIRPKYQRKPMARFARLKRRLFRRRKLTVSQLVEQELKVSSPDDDNTNERDEDNESVDTTTTSWRDSDKKQYTVKRFATKGPFCNRLTNFWSKNTEEILFHPGMFVMPYINWTYKNPFYAVFFSFLVIFMALNIAFALLLLIAGNARPECIVVAGEQFGYNEDSKLGDVFHLSWTTFTTVGYGAVYTATGTNYDSQESCAIVVFLVTVESFVGLLYAGMCAAILFGKVSRAQSHAQVVFSNAVCVQYGNEATVNDREETSALQSDDSSLDEPTPRVPKLLCPMIKFQLTNEHCNQTGGEILDATLRVVAANNHSSTGESNGIAQHFKLEMMEDEHPFFCCIWHGRHMLDEKSPLLSDYARSMIRKNDGFWPPLWNTPEKLREVLNFTDLIVIFGGICNISASHVIAFKKYKSGDVLIGYDFAPLLYKLPDTNVLNVDMTLLHDVVEQRGRKSLKIDDLSASVHMTESGRRLSTMPTGK